ncbi:hypothetical protein C5Y41_14610 [Rahnella variigena]|uniref:tetratricopeptide repeat protein n=1 Tax=Rahnella variigena TaxID=574964 RepID=UPI00101D5113|nr:hypothetical protein [Rahnella variigena]RYJ18385.1 hypothetical protein C5Y41_14610 [Rahnella variigena]
MKPVNFEKNDYIKIVSVNKSLPTVIAFSSVNTQKGKFKPYKILLSSGINIIFVNDCGNRWYQNGIEGLSHSSEVCALELVKKAKEIGNGKVITFGTSMGAYGALLYCALGKADGCLAFGSEPELCLPGSRSEQHILKGFSHPYPKLNPVLKDNDSKIIIFSSEIDEIDLMNSYSFCINNIPNVKNIIISGMEHPSVQVFDMNNTIGDIIKNFSITLDIDSPIPRESSIPPNSSLIPKLYKSVILKKNNENASWLNSLEKLNLDFPKTAVVLSKLGEARLRNKDEVGAIEAWLECINISNYQFEAHAKLGAIQRRNGDYDDAYANLKKAITINPFGAHTYHTLGLLYQNKENFPLAEINFRKANSINPGNKPFKDSLYKFISDDIQRKKAEINNWT